MLRIIEIEESQKPLGHNQPFNVLGSYGLEIFLLDLRLLLRDPDPSRLVLILRTI